MEDRYLYAWGYKSRWDAQEALNDMYNECSVSDGDIPKIEPYKTRLKSTGQKVTRYAVSLRS